MPKDAELYRVGGQIAVCKCPNTFQAFTRKGGKWFLKDLGKVGYAEVTDADYDGQVNDAIVVFKNGKRTVFSRMKDGTIVERPDLLSWQADLDGDGKNDAVYKTEQGVQVKFASGLKTSLKLPPVCFAVLDMDGDKVAEIFGSDVWSRPNSFVFHCWHYRNGKWEVSSSPKFDRVEIVGSDFWFDFPLSDLPLLRVFRDRKGVYLVAATTKGRLMRIWEVRWRKSKWMKRLVGEVPKSDLFEGIMLIRTGGDLLMLGIIQPPKWQRWLWDRIGRPLQRFLPFLSAPESQFSVWGWDGRQRWSLLGRWKEESFAGIQVLQQADMDGDGLWELGLAFPKKVLIAKFEDGRWRTSWVEVPFAGYEFIGGINSGLRYGGREWVICQDIDSHRCVAIALERER